jgi:hypothetical protein
LSWRSFSRTRKLRSSRSGAKTIVAGGKRPGLAGFVVAAAKIPRNQRVPDVHDMRADASPLSRTHCSAPTSSVLPSPLFCRVGSVAKGYPTSSLKGSIHTHPSKGAPSASFHFRSEALRLRQQVCAENVLGDAVAREISLLRAPASRARAPIGQHNRLLRHVGNMLCDSNQQIRSSCNQRPS